MTTVTSTSSITQYQNMNKMVSGQSPKSPSMFREMLENTAHAVRTNEQMGYQQAYGGMDVTKLSTYTAELDLHITTITALRDKVVSAFLELQKMQI